jgi:uncharacterized protein YmfQ (DUF2313 family)
MIVDKVKPILRDRAPWVIARWERKQAERLARAERRMIERFERLLGIWRCDICGASTERARAERCRGACR